MTRLNLTLLTICMSAGSVFAQGLSSGILKENMDLSVDPATNFYRYANGKWLDNNPIRPEYGRYGQFEVLAESNTMRLKEIVENLTKNSQRYGTNEQKIADLYTQYLDTASRNKAGCEPVKPYLEMVEIAPDKQALTDLTAKLQRLGIADLFFMTGVITDNDDATKHIVAIEQDGLGLPSKDYYQSSDSSMIEIMDEYKKYIRNLFVLAGKSESEANRMMSAVLEIENRIADGNLSPVERRDPAKNFNRTSFEKFKADYPAINWDNFFMIQGFPKFTELSVNQPVAIHNVEKIINEEPIENLRAYIESKILSTSAQCLDDKFNKVDFEMSQALSGVEEQEALWKRAINFVDESLGMALGKLYVEKYFSQNSKEAVTTMVKNIQKVLGEEVANSSWMSDATKQKAIEKLDNFYIKVGYPNKWIDYNDLKIDKNVSLLENYLNANKFDFDYEIKKHANQPIDKDEWGMTPQTVNAYYDPTDNSINFPAGILQPPFYNPQADEAANYGGVGCVIGHEMTHGFDDEGCKFDKVGNMRNWWTDKDKAEFDKRAKVLSDYFDKLEVFPGEYVNGELTLGENIADNGGIKIAFLALKNIMKTKDLGEKDGFTPEQRFFLAWATVWCTNIRDEEQRMRLNVDPHSPMLYRVNGQLPHNKYWYEAFHVTKKSPMYIKPKKRVDIW